VDPAFSDPLAKNGRIKWQLATLPPCSSRKAYCWGRTRVFKSKNACLPIFHIPFLGYVYKNFFLKIPTLFPNFCEHV